MYMYIYFRDSAYRARIQLAVLDHNAHISRSPKQHNSSQEFLYHRRYRKQTRQWDVVKVLEAKEFQYIPEMFGEVLKFWQQSSFSMKKRSTTLPSQTIAHIPPPDTCTIVTNKKSRFS